MVDCVPNVIAVRSDKDLYMFKYTVRVFIGHIICLAVAALLSGITCVHALEVNYTNSAHGDTTFGVKRSDMPDAYTTGNCAHCHVQHGSVDGSAGPAHGYALFSVNFAEGADIIYTSTDSVCFQCHTTSNSRQQGGSLPNPDYAETFGGFDEGTNQGVLEQYNPDTELEDSYHNLDEVQTYAAQNFAWFKKDTTPCVACHNPHLARRNKANVADPTYTAISLPSDHESLWGDDAGETMARYGGYQAPFYYNSTTAYEPGGLLTSDPSKVPDYVTFCNECHGSDKAPIYSTRRKRNLVMVDWSAAGDKHGARGRDGTTWLREPYATLGGKNNYVLSCVDCHEPHASPYPFLMRRSINGQPLNLNDPGLGPDKRGFQCLQCHRDDSKIDIGGTRGVNDWKAQHHGQGKDSPYSGDQVVNCGCHFPENDQPASKPSGNAVPAIRCEICHYHGSYVPNPAGKWPATVTPKNGAKKTF